MSLTLPKIPSVGVLESLLRTQPEGYWHKRGQRMALSLFRQAAQRVPAYKAFLRLNKVRPDKIKTIADLSLVPTTDKNNYLRSYKLPDLCWDGKLASNQWVISTTSGSTGDPFYFPRQDYQDEQYALTAELYLRDNFKIHQRSTLYIVGFPMGAWIGGVFTYQALKILAGRGYPLSIITPGINKAEILKAVVSLGKHYDQIIIGSYGPFLKDIIDDGIQAGVNWSDYKLGFVFSAEGFTEEFRDYVLAKTGCKDVLRSTLNHYGTVDLGTMSYETPLAISLRRMAVTDPKLYRGIFHETSKLPTLTQYIPEQFYFEDLGGNLVCSSFSGLPLVRYDLKDHGGVLTHKSARLACKTQGFDLDDAARRAKISNWALPFVYVYERSDFSVSLFAFQVYPESLRKALQKPQLEPSITGKFTMAVNYDRRRNQYLEVNTELKWGVKPSKKLASLVSSSIVKQLLADNSEYRKTYEEYPLRLVPKIVFWPYEDPRYFKPGTKQRWVNIKK